jgi:signal transduction histidine kinase
MKAVFLSSCILFHTALLFAQEKLSVQVKTFDQQLRPHGNLELSVNNGDFFSVGSRGTAIVDIPEKDLPPKSVTLKNEELEAESWNYSKGILEIIVRKKSYKVITVTVRTPDGRGVSQANLVFLGKKRFEASTNSLGRVEIPVGVSEKITSPAQFTIDGYVVHKVSATVKECFITVEAPVARKTPTIDKTKGKESSFADFDLKNLDSIQSLTVFYAIFKNYKMEGLSADDKRRVDLKFQLLISQLEDSLRNPGQVFLGKISDSSFVGEDVKNLLAQAEAEKQTLDYLRESFDDKIQVLNEKLSEGAGSLDAKTREKLMDDIGRLENILKQNEDKFYKNQNDYRAVLNSLKQKFFDIEDLENKLSMSEAQRLEEREEFRRKIFTIFLITICFALITLMLVHFSNRLKKQKKALEVANEEIKRINENLESLVFERTASLANAHREMDIFLYRASHDLRGPICSIIGLCNIASRTVNSESLEIVQKTYNTAFAMDRMLKKLKIISEINHPSNFSLIMLDEYIGTVKQEFRKFIRDNDINFKVDCPAAISFHSYPNLLEVILRNLVENALFFSTVRNNREAEIEIRAVHKKKYVELSVRDNGIGIDVEIRDRIWDMFFIGSEYSHGNGLGLYIVKKSVEVLQGSIDIQSEKGKYTLVTVQIPVQDVFSVGPKPESQLLVLQK